MNDPPDSPADDIRADRRCEHTGLIRSQCAHCRPPPPRPRFSDALFDPPGGGEDGDEDDIVATFPARYDGHCGQCDEHFRAGDWISKTLGGDYLCAECAS